MDVRHAQPFDAEALAILNQEFNGVVRAAEDIRLSLTTASDEHVLVVASDDGLLGFSCLQVVGSFCYRFPAAEVTELFVVPAARRRRLGMRLLLACVDLAKELGAHALTVRTNSNNAASQNLFRASGFETDPDQRFRRSLFARAG